MMDDLLIKYIVGEADEAEQEQVSAWIEADPLNRQAYERLYTIWQHSKSPAPGQEPDVNAAWQRFAAARAAETPQASMLVRKGGGWRRMVAAAAVLLVVLSGALWYLNTSGEVYRTNALAEVVTLPDQSTITLNHNSRLSCARNFNKKNRTVTLEGEAFFDVAKNPDKPFIIHVKDIDVRVVGTSFNIRSAADLTEVTVESGIVKVMRKDKAYTLRAQDKLIFRKGQAEAEINQVQNQLYQYYRTNMFVCEGATLSELVQGLKDAYGVPIAIQNPLLEHQHLTSKFPRTDSVEPILRKIAITLNAQLIKQEKGYILK